MTRSRASQSKHDRRVTAEVESYEARTCNPNIDSSGATIA